MAWGFFENLGAFIFIGIIIIILIFVVRDRTRIKRRSHSQPSFYDQDWIRQREIKLKKDRVAKFTSTKAQDTINHFKIQPFTLKREKFSDYPKIQCMSCGQIFRCHWGDDQLVSHQEQEKISRKIWKGFEEIS